MKMEQNKKTVWAVAEHSDGKVKKVTYEIAAFAGEFSRRFGFDTTILVIGRHVDPLAREIAGASGCKVIGIESDAAFVYNAEVYRHLLKKAFAKYEPAYIFIPHTATGWDYAPGLAVDIGASCVTAACGVKDEAGPLFVRQICNGKLNECARPLSERPAVVTVMPGSAQPEADATGNGSASILEMEAPQVRTKTMRHVEAPRASLNLQEAEVIVSAGRGVGGPDRLGPIRELASLFERGAVGASRPVCDNGWLPLDSQVGITGQTVSPKLYIACGISGAMQHTMAMKGAKLIVAINTDKNSLFCKAADYCVVEDLHRFIPALIEKIRRHKSAG